MRAMLVHTCIPSSSLFFFSFLRVADSRNYKSTARSHTQFSDRDNPFHTCHPFSPPHHPPSPLPLHPRRLLTHVQYSRTCLLRYLQPRGDLLCSERVNERPKPAKAPKIPDARQCQMSIYIRTSSTDGPPPPLSTPTPSTHGATLRGEGSHRRDATRRDETRRTDSRSGGLLARCGLLLLLLLLLLLAMDWGGGADHPRWMDGRGRSGNPPLPPPTIFFSLFSFFFFLSLSRLLRLAGRKL